MAARERGRVMDSYENNDDWYIRDFEEFDEKLPMIAKILVTREIDFRQLEEEEPDLEVLRTIITIMRENLECMSEMTADEIDRALNTLHIACELTCLTSAGLCEERDGVFRLTEEGRAYSAMLDELRVSAEEDTPCCDI